MDSKVTAYMCVNDRYSNTPVPYDSIEDFQEMCEAVHGEPVPMYEDGGGYFDRYDGALTLEPSEV